MSQSSLRIPIVLTAAKGWVVNSVIESQSSLRIPIVLTRTKDAAKGLGIQLSQSSLRIPIVLTP